MFEDLQVTTPRHFTYTVLQPRTNPLTYHPAMSNEIDDVRYEWRMGLWGECSVACEGGQRARIVKCTAQSRSQTKNEYVHDSKCDQASRPISVTTCNNFRCPMWNMGLWSDVSVFLIKWDMSKKKFQIIRFSLVQ